MRGITLRAPRPAAAAAGADGGMPSGRTVETPWWRYGRVNSVQVRETEQRGWSHGASSSAAAAAAATATAASFYRLIVVMSGGSGN